MNRAHRCPRLGPTLAILVSGLLIAYASTLAQEPGDEAGKRPETDTIPELPPEALPKRTRMPPDPATVQIVRDPVRVRVEEKVWTQKGAVYSPEVNVTTAYLEEYFRRAGFTIAEPAGPAKYTIDAVVEFVFDSELRFRDRVIGWKHIANARVRVTDEAGAELDTIEIPEFARDGTQSEETAVLDFRRYLSKLIADRLFEGSPSFVNKRVVELLARLRDDPLETAEPMRGEEVVEKLADVGLAAVPYLLEALTDTRTVLADCSYPGLERPDDLRVYHLADKALEEIFQKVSRMGIETPIRHRALIIRGWENEWRRFCPPFRESPQRERRLELEKERAEKDASADEPADELADEPAG